MSEIKALAVIQPEELISQAVNKGVPVETMERLLAMRTQIKQEQARESFFIALSKFQKECPVIEKTKPVKNAQGKEMYKYAPLDSIISQTKDIVEKHGFSYTIKTFQANNTITVVCEAHHIDGHTEPTEITLPVESKFMTAQQAVGAALSFAKRYTFCDAFGILTGDEDNDATSIAEEIPVKKEIKEPPELKALKELVTAYHTAKGGGTNKVIWLESLTEEVLRVKTADLSSLNIEQMATLSAAINRVKNDNNK